MKREITLFLFAFVSIFLLNSVLAQETANQTVQINSFVLPENFQSFAGFIFGIEGEQAVNIPNFIVLLCLFIILLLIIRSILDFIPIFDKFLIAWPVSLIISLLSSRTGALWEVSQFIFALTPGRASLKASFIVILLVILFYGLKILLRIVKIEVKKAKIEKSKMSGLKQGIK